MWAVREKYNSLNQELSTTHLRTHTPSQENLLACWMQVLCMGMTWIIPAWLMSPKTLNFCRWQKAWLCQQHEWITESSDNLDTLQRTRQKDVVMSNFRFYAAEAHSHVMCSSAQVMFIYARIILHHRFCEGGRLCRKAEVIVVFVFIFNEVQIWLENI